MTQATSAVETKLAAARMRLLMDKPFLGALVLRLPLKSAGAWCRTMATDARAIYYNPDWVNELSTAHAQFALAHEALHCGLGHFARRGQRVQRKWDIACDFAINPVLMDEGLKPPMDALVLDVYRGLSAEEIYPCLDDELEDNDTLDDHVWDSDEAEGGQGSGDSDPNKDSGSGGKKSDEGQNAGPSSQPDQTEQDEPPKPLSGIEKEHLQQQWQRYMAAAAQRARETGKLPASLARLCDAAIATQISWRAVLAQYLSMSGRDDYSWQRPSRRSGDVAANQFEVMWPSLRSHSGDVYVALDTSGSVSEADLSGFLAELNAIKAASKVRVTLFACDMQLAPDAPWVYEVWEPLKLPDNIDGGGGTSFTPVFDWIEKSGHKPDSLVYFTDAVGAFPKHAPEYPVMWLVKGKASVPFGQRIQLND